MNELDAMIRAAREAMERAYAPYSRFAVGACLATPSGRLYSGCNVENASYPEGQCAETSAIAAMILAGERRISSILVMAKVPEGCPPCGGCRQRLSEFAPPQTPVHLCNPDGLQKTLQLGELLPVIFDSRYLQDTEAAAEEPSEAPTDDG